MADQNTLLRARTYGTSSVAADDDARGRSIPDLSCLYVLHAGVLPKQLVQICISLLLLRPVRTEPFSLVMIHERTISCCNDFLIADDSCTKLVRELSHVVRLMGRTVKVSDSTGDVFEFDLFDHSSLGCV